MVLVLEINFIAFNLMRCTLDKAIGTRAAGQTRTNLHDRLTAVSIRCRSRTTRTDNRTAEAAELKRKPNLDR